MDGPHTPLSVYLRVIFFGCPYTLCMGSGSATGFFTAVRLVHSLLNFYFSVVILNSSVHYQIFEFDINIQILVWIIGSTHMYTEKQGCQLWETAWREIFFSSLTCPPKFAQRGGGGGGGSDSKNFSQKFFIMG